MHEKQITVDMIVKELNELFADPTKEIEIQVGTALNRVPGAIDKLRKYHDCIVNHTNEAFACDGQVSASGHAEKVYSILLLAVVEISGDLLRAGVRIGESMMLREMVR